MQNSTITNDSVIEILELHPSEMQLIRNLRKNWRYGEVTIVMRDGVPTRLKRIVEFADLDK
jgi:hypothetical protein